MDRAGRAGSPKGHRCLFGLRSECTASDVRSGLPGVCSGSGVVVGGSTVASGKSVDVNMSCVHTKPLLAEVPSS